MIRLRFVYTAYPHWAKHSGFTQFVKYLDQRQFNLTLDGYFNSGENDWLVKKRRVRGLLRRALQCQGMEWYKLCDLHAELRLFWNCCLRNVDVVHFLDGEHSPRFFPALSRLLPRSLRPVIIVTYHQPAHLLGTLVPKKIFHSLDGITVVSPEQLPVFQGVVPSDKLHVILHGIDTSFYRPDYPLQSNRFNCITVGHWLRDFPAIRKVATLLQADRSIHFHVVSPYPSGLESSSNITIYKGLDDEALLRLYQESQLLFLPVIHSTANNSLLEGIACGLPVVSTDLPSVRAYVSDKEAILVKENNAEDLIAAVFQLKNNPDEYRRRAKAARKRAEELDWRTIASQFEALYRSVRRMNSDYPTTAGPAPRERV